MRLKRQFAQGNDRCLAVDIGGTKTIVALVSRSGDILSKTQFRTLDDAYEQLEMCVSQARCLCDEMQLADNALAGIGVNVPGLADNGSGELLYASFRGWRNVKVRDYLQRSWPGLPIEIANDGNACALAEMMYGAGRGRSHLLWVTVSTGIGSGIILHNEIYEGCGGAAGELGHTIVEWSENGLRCGCGNRGCLEAHASGTAIAGMAERYVTETDGQSELARYFLNNRLEINALHVAEAARSGIAAAQEIYGQAGKYLGRALSYAINILNPGCIVIGGGGGLSFDLLESKVREVIASSVIGASNSNTAIIPTALGYEAAVVGAAGLIFHKY